MGNSVMALFLVVLGARVLVSSSQIQGPLSCSDTNQVCSAFLHYVSPANQQIQELEAMFNVWPADITVESSPWFVPAAPNQRSLFIKTKCFCSALDQGTPVYRYQVLSQGADYQGLQWKDVKLQEHAVWLLCGCSSSAYPFLLSYVAEAQDTVVRLSSRFGTSSNDIAMLNKVRQDGALVPGAVYYIPLNSAPGLLPSTAASVDERPVQQDSKGGGLSPAAIMGIAAAGVILLIAMLAYSLVKVEISGICSSSSSTISKKTSDLFSLKDHKVVQYAETPAAPREVVVTERRRSFGFSYENIASVTNGFKDANIIGQGALGCVYYGVLSEQEVAVKRIKVSKLKEELEGEVEALCAVKHSNLVRMLGYCSNAEEHLLVYEYAGNGSLSDQLHEQVVKGYSRLSWIHRLQIALDAAKGLEYIHDQVKPRNVHQDVKTSNILLDRNFRAMIADYGLAKLVGRRHQNPPRLVGTFGYLAPEYLHDGLPSPRSDVYAFGVVLFELITGQEPIPRNNLRTPERRSLVSKVVSELTDVTPLNMNGLREIADPLLAGLYPMDGFHRIAILGKQCVEDDPGSRPSMKQVVFTLSQVLFNSVEWEASLAGSSHIFSSIVQGR